MKVYCHKHINHLGFKMPALMVLIKSEDHLMMFYCPECNLEYWTRDCLVFYEKKEDVKEQ
jgi:hypothetical protein